MNRQCASDASRRIVARTRKGASGCSTLASVKPGSWLCRSARVVPISVHRQTSSARAQGFRLHCPSRQHESLVQRTRIGRFRSTGEVARLAPVAPRVHSERWIPHSNVTRQPQTADSSMPSSRFLHPVCPILLGLAYLQAHARAAHTLVAGHLRPDHAPRTRSRREVRWQAASRQSTVGQEIGEGASYAIRTGGYLEWDGIAGHFTNNPDANLLLKANYQNGWTFGT
jgi:hypothetical protein